MYQTRKINSYTAQETH